MTKVKMCGGDATDDNSGSDREFSDGDMDDSDDETCHETINVDAVQLREKKPTNNEASYISGSDDLTIEGILGKDHDKVRREFQYCSVVPFFIFTPVVAQSYLRRNVE
jgi:hypothetical protein